MHRREYGEKITTHLLHVVLAQVGVGEVDSKCSVDLNIDEAGAYNIVLRVNHLSVSRTIETHLVGVHLVRVDTTVEVGLRIQDLAVANPEIAQFDLRLTKAEKTHLAVSKNASVGDADDPILLHGMVIGVD